MNLTWLRTAVLIAASTFLFSVTGLAAPTEILCAGEYPNEVPTFLSMARSNDGTYTVSTETTDRFLLGLVCTFSPKADHVFSCLIPGSTVKFYSRQVIEKGYIDAYGTYIETDILKIQLSYQFQNSAGNYQSVNTVREYQLSTCVVK